MEELPPCPKCACTYTYQERDLVVCPECAHEWNPNAAASEASDDSTEANKVWRDANGVELQNGDTVTVIKDLKVKGAPNPVKAGTKVKNIRLVHGDHDIDCRIDGFGAMGLKSEFVRKV